MWKSSARPVFKGLALASGLAIPAVLVASSGGLGQAHAKEREFQNEVAFPAAPWGQYLKEVTGIGAVRAADLDMLQAQVVFRHGARSPFSDSPEKPGLWHEKLRTNLGDLPPAGMKHLTTKEDVDAKGLRNSTFEVENLKGGSSGLRNSTFGCENHIDFEDAFDFWLRNSTFDSENLKGGLEKGTLTDAGVRQARALGGVLGERYRAAGILGAPLAEGEVVLRSSFTKRTIETLQGVMSGIFPADALERKPIVVHGVMSGIFPADALARKPIVVHEHGSNGHEFPPPTPNP
ncbi:histidine phosphatase superfamily [Baffinella frigidus]|nr:histidine phosphatase superfamily [Cryptophyta sp. CCMP2293]